MSTTPNVSLQVYDRDGTPMPPSVSRERLVDLVRSAYARGGKHLDRDVVDLELAEIADKAACSLLRDRWNDDFPIAAYTELLSAVAAVRAVLGFAPTPTAREVHEWAENLGKQMAEEIDGLVSPCFIQFVNGPYKGAVLSVPARTPAMGPANTLTLPIAWGDTEQPGRGEAQYERIPIPDEGLWLYRLIHEAPEGSRPHITLPDRQDGV
ncbi:hypothetical protein [Streptomyces cahuitamycinicus]|uniref:Uncharacterized protein n=1 Tax=Streptomyces cahuitamycinicus TaxID=2070367 RepID=A0A2N8TTJ1_9ACTN|nr:hypothetical protein [Streptomyces cahuitamycinicus]PNG22346.1 hypothetical protein C1J00_10040 [Streptomyces cahuitamycinicus]